MDIFQSTPKSLEEDLKESLRKPGEEALSGFRDNVAKDYFKFEKKSKALAKEYTKFQLQLMTISGGTISVFLALQTSDPPFLAKLGFAFLGASLVLGVFSVFLGLESKTNDLFLQEGFLVKGQKTYLEFLEKIYPLDTKTDKEIIDTQEGLVSDFASYLDKRSQFFNKVLGFLHLKGQMIEDGQIAFFVLGGVSLILSLF